MTVRDAYDLLASVLEPLYGDREGNIMARYLVEDLFARPFHNEDLLTGDEDATLQQAVLRLQKYEPWQYVGGIADFYGLRFKVTPSVLIPRPETEELVYRALADIKKFSLGSVMDVGTGSGIIAVTLSKKSPETTVTAIDISEEALSVARANADLHGVSVDFMCVDFLDKKLWTKLPVADLIVSNPPYIDRGEESTMHPNVLEHEPHIALFTAGHPLEFYEAMAEFVSKCQKPGCRILAEISEFRSREVHDLFVRWGFSDVAILQDLQGKDRMVTARWQPAVTDSLP